MDVLFHWMAKLVPVVRWLLQEVMMMQQLVVIKLVTSSTAGIHTRVVSVVVSVNRAIPARMLCIHSVSMSRPMVVLRVLSVRVT